MLDLKIKRHIHNKNLIGKIKYPLNNKKQKEINKCKLQINKRFL